MGNRVRCFWIEPTDQVELSLRRYARGDEKCPTSGYGYHNAEAVLERLSIAELAGRGWPMSEGRAVHGVDTIPKKDPRWPAKCACGYVFAEPDAWQCNPSTLYRRADTGELMLLAKAPPGAIWRAPWFEDHPAWRGPDGRTLVCRCPDGHDWIIDSHASNCTLPDDHAHKCWVRHGEPPDLTVDKNGATCAAGGGSIQTSKWHGFLRNGWLEE